MRESTVVHGFTAAENLGRLRNCLKGEAREHVSGLLYTATDPAVIMKTLEQTYGRPEIIIDRALEEIKKLPRSGSSASELNTLATKLQNIVTSISCVDNRGYLLNPMLARQVIDKLSLPLQVKWWDFAEQSTGEGEPEIVRLSRFLMGEADKAMRHSYSTPSRSTTDMNVARETRAKPPRINERRRVYTTSAEKKDVCHCCGEGHLTTQCGRLAAMTVPERWKWAKEARICFLCLRSKHQRFRCGAKKCGVNECREPHHALLHLRKDAEAVREPTERKESAGKPTRNEESVMTASAHKANTNEKVLLKVCPITVKGRNGEEVSTYALLDEGSTITLVDEEIAAKIGADGPKRPLNIHGINSSQREAQSRMVSLAVRGKEQPHYHQIKARTVKKLTLGNHSVRREVVQQLRHLKTLREDDVCYENVKPRVLIGADNWHLIVTRKLLAGKKNQPAASLTLLGWTVHGSAPRGVVMSQGIDRVLHIRSWQGDGSRDELFEMVKSHFDMDALGISSKKKPVAEEERALKIFSDTVRKVDGRFEVGLPWREDVVSMPSSYDMAIQRLRGIERKMDRSPQFREAYTTQVNKLLDKGYAEPCEEGHVVNGRTWYVPHFAVTNPNKPGKVRLVFDAAARSDGVCLNDVLLDGPDLLQALYGILFRFREGKIAVTADIREMFLRVKIRRKDRTVQHFLWRGDDRRGIPRRYVMTSMIFGARSSPFLAHSVRNRNAEDNKETHPRAYLAITQNHYMDDWVQSFADEAEAARTIAEVREVHGKAGFELAGWDSNREHLMIDIPEEDRARQPKELGANAHPYGKTLGVLWIPETDELAFNTMMPRVPEDIRDGSRTPTKREALGMVMSLFDPLGLLSPYTVRAKITLQKLWRIKLGWDEPLPEEEAREFEEWIQDLDSIKELRLPRCYGRDEDVVNTELHIFTDASEQAYAAAAYWRFERRDGSVSVALIAGKAKVAPMKAQSIPRMELQAALIGARLAAEIRREHGFEPRDVTFWSDSKTVLHWVRNDSARYTPFVAHRLGEIGELTEPGQWRWVPTKENVADDATRIGGSILKTDDRWFVGPGFLYGPRNEWPKELPANDETTEVLVNFATDAEPFIDATRFSTYGKLLRATAYALAFIDMCRRKTKSMEARHTEEAERLLVRQAQRESFSEDYERLKRGERVKRGSRLHKLDPEYGGDGIIRLNGRIKAAPLAELVRSPPILDGAHHITRLMIRQEHEAHHHVGTEHIVNNMRQKYWILRLRPAARHVMHQCINCRLRKTAPTVPVKGDLPRDRLAAYTRPFSNCGVDCFGPMWVTIGRRREKRWGMLFTCLVTRAVHIELIASLSTDSAIMAIRRMGARRGWPKTMWSDNGTNFHGADAELRTAHARWVQEAPSYVKKRPLAWRYIDPGAPNQGGAWERLIRTVKTALHATLAEQAPKEEVLITTMAEIEHTVNSRPLTHVSVSAEDEDALTPNHFLIGSATGLPITGVTEIADRKTWFASQALADKFWTRWLREYLPTLAARDDVRRKEERVHVGDVVIIADGLLPRNVWPRGVVERTYIGPDNVVRSAEVRTKGGIFRRPVRRLIVLTKEDGSEDLRRGEDVADRITPLTSPP
ncbi:hypothetical protein K1T71_006727 [Dendrolimus kikuchii]|uniref:Uncharacterized protein n=1 Tax=Dendrolimus kikuchii TaxID=765133 RepID=A0ACC1D1L4_9NEOP|nr:hypothetical protein K1T71_006727 [Dendrolimus kikuchii]